MKKVAVLSNGKKIEIGDIAVLEDLVGEKYKQTKNYDVGLENPIEIYKYDEFDFKYVELIPEEGNKNKLDIPIIVPKLLSGFCDEIISFEFNSTKIIAITNFLRIDINKAVENGEIRIVKNDFDIKNQKSDIGLIKIIQEHYDIYSTGLWTFKELKEQLEFQNHHYFQYQEKWKTNFAQSINGKFYKKNTVQ